MNRRPTRRAVRALRVAKATVLGALASVLIGLFLGSAPVTTSDASARLAERAGIDVRCAPAGAAGRALVRTSNGAVELVSFAQGWAVYRGERPGTLLTVCPEPGRLAAPVHAP